MNTNIEILKMLEHPSGLVDAVIDTDTYNEIDDQFALSYLLKSGDKISTKAVYAAPFFNAHSTSPEDGMLKSYDEILKLLDFMGNQEMKPKVFKGSSAYLPDESTPVESEAARHLAKLAMEYSREKPLYVIAIGAITNVASAILLNPEIISRMVVIWLGGHALGWPDTKEFNMVQDIAAARVVFGSTVPLVQLPCMGVVSAFTASGDDLKNQLSGKNKLCDYLVDTTFNEVKSYTDSSVWTRAIWDVTAVGWLVGGFMEDSVMHAPVPDYDGRYAFCQHNHFYKYVYHIDRDGLMRDLFNKLSK